MHYFVQEQFSFFSFRSRPIKYLALHIYLYLLLSIYYTMILYIKRLKVKKKTPGRKNNVLVALTLIIVINN